MSFLKKTIPFLSLIIFAMACSSKSAEPLTKQPPQEKKPVAPPKPADTENPCITFSKLNPVDREKAETAYVLYKDEFKFKNYNKALSLWKTAISMAPAANGRVKYQYDDGIAIYKHFFDQTEDQMLKKSYMDTIMAIYDKRARCFGEEDYIAARKAFDNYYVFGDLADNDQTFEWFRQAIDSKGVDVEYFVLNPFTKLLYDKILSDEISLADGQKYATIILDAVESGLQNCEEDCETWEIINDYSPKRLEALEGIEGFYTCSYYEEKYYPQFQSNPEDCENINEVYRKLLWGKCDSINPKIIEISNAKNIHCYTPPPPEGPLKRAFNAYNDGKFREAIQLFDEFVQRTEDLDKKGRYSLLVAKIYYRDIKNFNQARKYALSAAEYKDNWGEPYMLIGKLYASSGPLCGPGRGWDSQIVTWPAIDKFEYAKKVDPSMTKEANEWIRTYSQYMPSIEEIFQRPTINEGDRFFVGCWIQEWTTIRAARS